VVSKVPSASPPKQTLICPTFRSTRSLQTIRVHAARQGTASKEGYSQVDVPEKGTDPCYEETTFWHFYE